MKAGSKILDGSPEVIEERFVYGIENDDEQQELFTASEFPQPIGSHKTGRNANHDRDYQFDQ
jgi:hypothetical protein